MDSQVALAPREQQVLEHLVAGLASKEVAYEMGLSIETVLWYSKRIYRSLRVHNRAEAVRVALERRLVLHGGPAGDDPAAPSAPIRPLIGRAEQLATLDGLLAKERLVCLVGMGGVGKTALALEAARRAWPRYTHGVVEVQLDHVGDEPGLGAALAAAAGVPHRDPDADAWALLRTRLANRECLLLLDNFEQLHAHGRRLAELLAALPKLAMLVTSRLPLDLPGETVLRLGGMRSPRENDAAPGEYEAVALFTDEVRRRAPERRFGPRDLEAIGEVCRRLDGMPLALLLAASWSDTLPLERIVDDIKGPRALLASDSLVPTRHRRVDEVIDATLALRSPQERSVLARLSVCAGSFDRDAAQAVAATAVDTLSALVRSSLLLWDPDSDRYRMHPLVEDRARVEAERLGIQADAVRAHLSCYAALVARLRAPLLGAKTGLGQAEASRTLDLEQGNVRFAWHSALEAGDLRAIGEMVEPLVLWSDLRTRLADALLLIRAALASPAGATHRGLLQLFDAWLALQAGTRSVLPSARAAREHLEGSNAPREQVLAGDVIAAFVLVVVEGDVEGGLALLDALEGKRDALPAYWDARRLMLLTFLRSGMGDTAGALATASQMLDVALAGGDFAGAHLAVVQGAWMALRLGELGSIPRYLEIGEQLMERLVDEQTAAVTESLRALLSLWRGERDAARDLNVIGCDDNVSIRSLVSAIAGLQAGLHGRRIEAESARAAVDVEAIAGLYPEVTAWAEWGLALACAGSGDWDGARTHVERMAEIERAPWCALPEHPALGALVDALQLAGDGARDAARARLEEAWATPSRAHAMYRAWAPIAGLAAG